MTVEGHKRRGRTRSSARYMFAVKMSAPAPCYAKISEGMDRDPRSYHGFAKEVLL